MITTPGLRPLAALTAGFVLLAACGGDDASTAETTPATQATTATTAAPLALEGSQWTTDLGELGAPGVTGTLLLVEGQASGSSGCNSFTGTYVLDGGSLTFDGLASTQMACDDAVMAAEGEMIAALGDTTGYTIEGNELTLTGDAGALLSFTAVSGGALVGTWTITGYLATGGDAFTSTVAGTEPTIVFNQDGTLTGETGCNAVNAGYTAGPGTIAVGQIASTQMACEQELMDQEAAITASLTAATSWEATSDGVVLLAEDGTRLLTLSRVA